MAIKEFPEFSWSNSRHKTVMECPTKYYRSYYAYHNGWQKNSDAITKHVYRLKKITNLEMFMGERIHQYIEDIAKNKNKTISENVTITHIWEKIEKAIDSSFGDYNKWYDSPSKYTMLHEVYYENEVPNEKISNLKERLNVVIHNLFKNKTFIDLLQKKIAVHPDTEQFRFLNKNGIKIWLRIDLHYSDQFTGDSYVVDWKTGKSDENDRNQLALYSHFVSRAYRVDDLSKIHVRNEYLLDNESKSYSVKQIDVNKMKELINMSINHMQGFLEDVDNNIPLHESFFDRTTNHWVCNRCNFKEMCGVR